MRRPSHVSIYGRKFICIGSALESSNVQLTVTNPNDLDDVLRELILSSLRRLTIKHYLTLSLTVAPDSGFTYANGVLRIPERATLDPNGFKTKFLHLIGLALWDKVLEVDQQVDWDKLLENDPIHTEGASPEFEFADAFVKQQKGRLTGAKQAFFKVHLLPDSRYRTRTQDLSTRHNPTRFMPQPADPREVPS